MARVTDLFAERPHTELLRAILAAGCPHCHCSKPPSLAPLCAACFNRLPLSCRQDLDRLEDVIDGYQRSISFLSVNNPQP